MNPEIKNWANIHEDITNAILYKYYELNGYSKETINKIHTDTQNIVRYTFLLTAFNKNIPQNEREAIINNISKRKENIRKMLKEPNNSKLTIDQVISKTVAALDSLWLVDMPKLIEEKFGVKMR